MILTAWAVIGVIYYCVAEYPKHRKQRSKPVSGRGVIDNSNSTEIDGYTGVSERLRMEAEEELKRAECDYVQLLFAEASELEDQYSRKGIGEERNKLYKKWQKSRAAAWAAQLKYVKKWEE